jgi:type II secretory pathway pseudopilin PulG
MSLVEVLIAMTVLLFVSLALMQTALVSIDANMKNVIRDEGVRVAEARMISMRNEDFDTLIATPAITNTAHLEIRSIIANAPGAPGWDFFSITNTVSGPADLGHPDRRRITVFVEWDYKDGVYNTTLSSIRSR